MSSTKLPPEKEDHIVDVSLKQVAALFAALVLCVIIAGSAIVLLRDYSRSRRQKATIEAITQVILILQKGALCKQESSQKTPDTP
ncbi:MAG: hypothetical protein CV087_21760 [Candidatus Brocadia sp. WS118]|nr:MAG: hypothetical protein CV087_21760 [Candidatus Brocadia sp. WS118]